MMTWQAIASLAVFGGVIFFLTTEWIHFTVASMLGALLLIALNVITVNEAFSYIGNSHVTLALFFGVMVMVRAFEPTKIFEYLGTQIVIWAKGRGDRLLLAIVGIVTPICAVLPNATTVMLLAPLIPPIAEEVGVDFVPLLILMVFVANSAGLLTIIGDPATFIVGSSINLSFTDYLLRLSFGGVVAILVIVAMLPILFRHIWRKKLQDLERLPHVKIQHPKVLLWGGGIAAVVLIFFIVGEMLPVPVSPATVALLGATLIMLITHHSKTESVSHILRDVDWSTLLFFMSIFVLIGSLEKTGVISSLSGVLAIVLGKNIALGAITLVFFVGAISALVPNIPLVIAMVPLLKQYVVNVGLANPEVLEKGFTGQFPPAVLPLFYAMMFGATLGGNGTVVGASSNIVAAGIAEQHGKRISFRRYLLYGVPMTVLQLTAAAVFITLRFLL
ncbi:MAG: ArsB/NhaD family transporter [Pseudanabaenaceae cyanobacterium]|jgi:Na+/H+ antiporter NhaD/arsenite permease-like protein